MKPGKGHLGNIGLHTVLCLFAVSVALGADDASPPDRCREILAEHHIDATIGGVTAYLESLQSIESRRAWQDQLVAKLIAQLNDDDWSARHAAMQTLTTMPVRARPALTRALGHDDLEIVWRARQALQKIDGMTDETALDQAMLIAAVCRAIEAEPIRGAASVLLDATRHIRQKFVLGYVRAALAATARAQDADLLRQAIAGEDADVRAAAIVALGRVEADAGELRAMLGGDDPMAKAAAAHALGQQGDREGLGVLVELLEADRLSIRSEAVRVLRAMTGQRFGYTAYDELAKQQSAVAQWRQWVQTSGAEAELIHPFKLDRDQFEAFYRRLTVRSRGGGRYGRTNFGLDGKPWDGRGGQFHDSRGLTMMAVHQGKTLVLRTFDTYRSPLITDDFAKAIAALPVGCFVVLGVNDEATANFNATGQRALESIGGKINLKGNTSKGGGRSHWRASYLCVGYKGLPSGYALDKLAVRQSIVWFSGNDY